MTEVRYIERHGMVSISLSGHALFNPGNDIVCSALSLLSYQVTAGAEMLADRGDIESLSHEERDGWCKVVFKPLTVAWFTLWMVIEHCFEELAKEYPENVSFIAVHDNALRD